MPRPHLFMVRMDVAHDRDALFNEVYDREHIPAVLEVPGMLRAARYRNPSPTDPRHMAVYEVAGPEVIASPALKAAGDRGRWATEVRPHLMNRHRALYEWVGGSERLTYRTRYVYWVMMDVERHREALFNELYDAEHLPLLLKIPGVANAVRFRTEAEGEPRYLAAYEIERPELPAGAAWTEAADTGRWKPEVRPYTYNKRFIVAELVTGGA
jgi:hypothetical protein